MTQPLRVEHRFNVSAERVYDAFIDVRIARQFLFATPAGEMVVAELEPRVGGAFRFVDRRDDQDVEHVGKFIELVRPTRVAFEFSVPAFSSLTTKVTVDITPIDGGSRVILTHEGVPPEVAERSAGGWQKMLAGLERALGA